MTYNAPPEPAPSTPLPVVQIGGVRIVALDRRGWAHWVLSQARARRGNMVPLFLTSANGNVLSRYASSPEFRALMDAADAIDADGQPLVVASRLLTRTPIPERCATTDFFHDICREAETSGASIYLLGATEDMNARAATVTQQLYPKLRIAGRRNGYFTLEDESTIVDQINAVSPDILWVGLGVPREQAFVVRNRARLMSVGALKTCGGLFDFVAGKNSRAPQWMRDHSLEWLYRVWLEPRRLFWRYLVTNVHTLWLLATRTGDIPRR